MPKPLRNCFIKMVLPFASWWVERQECRILEEGISLSETEKRWAEDLGIQEVDKIRKLFVSKVPMPGYPISNYICERLPSPMSPIGLCARYGIYLEVGRRSDPSILVHELVHTVQYERMGSIREFVREYLEECLRDGYEAAAMELEAQEAAVPFNRPPDR